MKENVLILDNFTVLRFTGFPNFFVMANRCGLINIKEAYEIRSFTFSTGGQDTELSLMQNPEIFSDPLKRVLAFFVISLALSQYPKFRFTNGPSGFLGMKTNYITVVGTKDKSLYASDANEFYNSAMRLYTKR